MKGIAITTAAAACCLAVTTANKLPTSSTFGIGRTTTFARGGAIGKFYNYILLSCIYLL